MPAAAASSAASTLLRMPPLPSGLESPSSRPLAWAPRSKKPGSLCVLVRTTDGVEAGVAVTAGVASIEGFGGLIASGMTVPGAAE